MSLKKILITGGAGFIGSNLADVLLLSGHCVRVIDNFEPNYAREIKLQNIGGALLHKNYSFVEGDITKTEDIRQCFDSFLPDIVVHLAAKSGVRPSINAPLEYFQGNVLGTINLLEAMKNYGVKKMIFASSSSVYGNCKNVPFCETESVDHPISPYAASKKACELLCHTYHHLFGFHIFCLRFFTVYGPRQRPDLAIYKFTEKMMKQQEVEIYGDGCTSRDYTYIEDILDGIKASIDKVKGFEIINLGESKVVSLRRLVAILEECLNTKAILKQLPLQPGDVNTTYADISKARSLLGYDPKWSIENGIKAFIDWKMS